MIVLPPKKVIQSTPNFKNSRMMQQIVQNLISYYHDLILSYDIYVKYFCQYFNINLSLCAEIVFFPNFDSKSKY